MTDHLDPMFYRDHYRNVDAPSIPPAIRRKRAWRIFVRGFSIGLGIAACGFFGFAMAMIYGGVW